MVRVLVEGHEAVARTARAVFPLADKADDQPTADLLTQRLDVHEKTAWMLRSLLPAPQRRTGQRSAQDERNLVQALASGDRKALLDAFEHDRSHVEEMLLNLLAARDL